MKYSNIAIPEDVHVKLKIYCATHGNITIKEAVTVIISKFLLDEVKFTEDTLSFQQMKHEVEQRNV